MPNDPRVKFHKGGKICRNDLAYLKMHPECYGFITDRGPLRSGGGSGAGGGGGVTPGPGPGPPGPGPGPPGPGPGPPGPGPGPPGPTPIPGNDPFNPVPYEIAGGVIGGAAAIAAAYAAKRAYDEEQRRRGFRPLVEEGGVELRPTGRPAIRPSIPKVIQAEFAPISQGSPGTISPVIDDSTSINRGTSEKGTSLRRTPTINELRQGLREALTLPRGRGFYGQPPSEQELAQLRPVDPQTLVDFYGDRPLTGEGPPSPGGSRTPLEVNEMINLENQIETTKSEIIFLENEIKTEKNQTIKNVKKRELKILKEKVAALEAPTNKLALKQTATTLRETMAKQIEKGNIGRGIERTRGIPRGINDTKPVGNNPINDSLNAAQSTRQVPQQTTAAAADTITADLPAASRGRTLGSIQAADSIPKSSSLTNIELNTPKPSLRQQALERATAFIDRNNPFAARAKVEPMPEFKFKPGTKFSDVELDDLFNMSKGTPLQPQESRAALGPKPAPAEAPPAEVETSLKPAPKYSKPPPYKETPTKVTDANRLASAKETLKYINQELNKVQTPERVASLKTTKINTEKTIRNLERVNQFELEFKMLTEPAFDEAGRLLPQETSHRMSQKADIDAQPEASRLWKEKLQTEYLKNGVMPEESVRLKLAAVAIDQAEEALERGIAPAPEPRPAKETPLQPQETARPLQSQETASGAAPSTAPGGELKTALQEIEVAPSSTARGKRKLIKKTGITIGEADEITKQIKINEARIAQLNEQIGETRHYARGKTNERLDTIKTKEGELIRTNKLSLEQARSQLVEEVEAMKMQLKEIETIRPRMPTPPKPRPANQAAGTETDTRPGRTPIGEPGPSPPPSAPESEVSTPREGAITEQTPAERAAFAEELGGRLKKVPRQKAKVNFGKTNKNTRNPLDIFVNPEFRNVPHGELHPTAKSFRGTLTEFSSGARVPRLMPSRSTLINMSAEGGGTLAGLAAGYFSTEAMNNYFAQHPAKNFGEAYGQALASGLTGAVVGAITQQVVSAAIRAGVEYAIAGEISGSLSGLGAGPGAIAASIAEAAVFTTVAVTTQMTVQKQLDDAGYDHQHSRGYTSLAVTGALSATNVVMWLSKGGPFNPAADMAFLVNEIFILGYGIYSLVTEHEAGVQQDWDEYYLKKDAKERADRAEHDRMDRVERIMRMNVVRKDFILRLKLNDYDFDKTLALFNEEEQVALGVYSLKGQAPAGYSYEEFTDGLKAELNPLYQSERDLAVEAGGLEGGGVVLTGDEKLKHETYVAYVTSLVNDYYGIPNETPFNWNSPGVKLLDAETAGSWTFTAETTASSAYVLGSRRQAEISTAQNQVLESFTKERKTIEELDPQLVAIANADKNFKPYYDTYIVAAAQAEIYMEFNRTQFTYHDMDQKLVEIANRDPTFQGAVEHYYEVMSSMARDLDLTITEVARLNALAANDQAIEIGKLNDARNKIIAQTKERNQKQIDEYNASIVREISMYGDNFDAIIRNINDQALVTGHTFLYATNRADLYRQLHMEMPELELVDPDSELPRNIGDPNREPTYQDLTIMYPEQYRRLYQNFLQNGYSPEEANDMTEEALRILYQSSPVPLPAIISVKPAKGRKIGDTALYGYRYNLTDEQNQELEDMIASGKITRDQANSQAKLIYNRDRYLFEKTDKEKADDLGMTLEDYYATYGMPVPPEPEPEKGTPEITPTTPTTPETPITPETQPTQPQETASGAAPRPTREPTYEELKVMYPDKYDRIYNAYIKYGDPATANENTEIVLKMEYQTNPVPLPLQPQETASGAAPRTTPTSSEPTYAQLVQMYGDIFAGTNNPEANLRALHADNVSQGTAPATPAAAAAPAAPVTQRPGTDVIPEFTPGARSHEYMNPATRANDAAGISNMNNEPENP